MAVFRPSSSRRGARRLSYKKRTPWTKFRATRRSKALIPRIPTYGVGPPVNGFPSVMRTSLRYCDNFSLSSASGGVGSNIFRMNSLFDPDYTRTGHQPLYYDQFTPVYGRYRVLYSKLNVSFVPLSDDSDAATSGPWIVGVTGNSNGVFSTSATVLSEQNKTFTRLLPRDKAALPVDLTLTYSPKRDLGVDPEDDTVTASTSGNPSSVWWGNVFVSDLNGSGTTTVIVKITMEFEVEFYAQSNIADS